MVIIQNLTNKKIDFKAVHFTDMHIGINDYANQIGQFMTRVTSNPVGIYLNTGDTMDDSNNVPSTYLALKAQLETVAPVIKALGNHDFVYSAVQLGMPSDYYYYDKGTWRFIVLANMGTRVVGTYPTSYGIDNTQLTWLQDTLAASSGKNICILTHVPILSVGDIIWEARKIGGSTTKLESENLFVDQMTALFKQYRNVKICLSGHDHTNDFCEFEGVQYLMTGAVSGTWWGSPSTQPQTQPRCYRNLVFYKDGTVRHEIVNY
jgi:3',5'-cyclic-AMP phosphodiesterase